jgi:hypothetical protein
METPSADVCTAMLDTLKERRRMLLLNRRMRMLALHWRIAEKRYFILGMCWRQSVSSSLAVLAAALEASAAWSEAPVKASAKAVAVARQSSSAPAPSAKNSLCPL